MHTIYLGLSSNVGNRKQYLDTAITKLKKHMQQVTVAKYYENKPMYYVDQNDFINTVLRAETNLEPEALLSFIKDLEVTIGRKKRFRMGPREIDIDILFFDDMVLSKEGLEIPHPGIPERDFVLKPFMELDPHFVHPLLKREIQELFKELHEQ